MLLSITRFNYILPRTVRGGLGVTTIRLRGLKFRRFNKMIIPNGASYLSNYTSNFRRGIGGLIRAIFIGFTILGRVIMFSVILSGLPMGLCYTVTFHFHSFPFQQHDHFTVHGKRKI